jgi:hypothetical protein
MKGDFPPFPFPFPPPGKKPAGGTDPRKQLAQIAAQQLSRQEPAPDPLGVALDALLWLNSCALGGAAVSPFLSPTAIFVAGVVAGLGGAVLGVAAWKLPHLRLPVLYRSVLGVFGIALGVRV